MATIKHTFSNRLTTSNAPSETNYTLQEIADMMNITKERVRQIEAKALNKLRQHLRSLGHTQNNLLNT
jgi:DNA-directed RNA polymerase sigma subunit (sigma70/sigma32)